MDETKINAFKNEAEKLEEKLRGNGYLSTDIVTLAYFLIENNIEKAELLEEKNDGLNDLINKVENLLKL